MHSILLTVFLAVFSVPLVIGMYGLLALFWRGMVHYRLHVLDIIEFLLNNFAFTAIMVVITGVSLEVRPMGWGQKFQFVASFVLLYVAARNTAKIRTDVVQQEKKQKP